MSDQKIATVLDRKRAGLAKTPSVVATDGLGPVLAELERVRAEAIGNIPAQGAWRASLLAALVLAFWILTLATGEARPIGDLLKSMLMASLGGLAWATLAMGRRYRRAYKARILPRLAAGFGELAWRRAKLDIDAFKRHRLFPDWDSCDAEDELFGRYRGLEVSVVQMKLTKDDQESEHVVFKGLAATVVLPRELRGVTVVVPGRGPFGNLKDRIKGVCESVRVEDPEFAAAYRTYASDQIAARALLTPAFMIRFLALSRSARFGPPAAMVRDRRLLVALPTGDREFLAGPSLFRPASDSDGLEALARDLRTILDAVDTVIDLDQASRQQAPRRA
jgi:hypothetical protein